MKSIAVLGVVVALAGSPAGAQVGGVIGGGLGKTIGSNLIKDPAEAQLEKIAAGLNKTGPVMTDAETRFDSAEAGPGRRFAYFYTLVSVSSSQSNRDAFVKTFAPGVRSRACANSGLVPIFKNGVTVRYMYSTNDSQPLGSVTVTPIDCGYK